MPRLSPRLAAAALLAGMALAASHPADAKTWRIGFVPKLIFCLTWGVLNFFWLVLLRRPAITALTGK